MKRIIAALTVILLALPLSAQRGDNPDSWEVQVNTMDEGKRLMITEMVEKMQAAGGAERGLVLDMLKASGYGLVTTAIEIVAGEVVNLAKYRSNQKKQWMQMIEKECNYTDSLSSIQGLKDFYSETSRYGALDPSNMNFDGITIRGVKDGHEMLYLSCRIDTTRLEELFQHSKFHLMLDTLSFNPYECHLPNLSANGIRLRGDSDSGRDNSFSFDERSNLHVGIDLTLTSSWINEAVMVQRDVELGQFKLEMEIPAGVQVFTYSRAAIDENRRRMAADPTLKLDTRYLQMEGECFVVPRSFMPVSGTERMWGTGEYNMKVKFRESCRFLQDASRNEKLKYWHEDYKRLRKMQKKGSAFNDYFRTLWSQNGDKIVKTVVKQGLTTGASAAGLTGPSSARKTGGDSGTPSGTAGTPPANKKGDK